ncbi:MAG: LD-carboxypeptidase, partial [Hymenobacter sp.]
MPAISPPALLPGQRVAIVAPARKISPAEVEFACQTLTNWGLDVVLGESIGAASH